MRRALGTIVLLLLLGAAPARAAQLVTWDTTSRYVDPSHVTFNGVQPGLKVNVLLPDGFDPNRCHPVLYLLHGHGDAYDTWAKPDSGDVQEVAKGFPAIIVMPEGDHGWYVNWWNDGARSPAWESYHLDELIPLVEQRLRICPGRSNRAIAGLSMGGEGAIYYAEQRPGYFGAAASFSGPLSIQRLEWPTGFDTQGEHNRDVFGDPQAQKFYWEGHNPVALLKNLRYTRLFVTVGDGTPAPKPDELTNTFGQVAERDLRMHADDFVAAAHRLGDIDVTYHPRQGIHAWPYWRAHLADAIQWGFFRPVGETPAFWWFSTVETQSDAWGFHLAFAKPPEALETFHRHGRSLSATGSGTVTVTTPEGTRFTRALPFDVKLPKPRRYDRSHAHHVRKAGLPVLSGRARGSDRGGR
ncbi:MAG: alpha/beta hydrolase [Gaiellaceae bacterium]